MAKSYISILRRRREGKTDYRRRKKIISGRLPYVSVHVSGKNISVQVIEAKVGGDITLASAHSRELEKSGWKGSMNSLPSAYLVGLTAGLKAAKVGTKKVIVRPQIRGFVWGSRLTSAIKGIRDAGLDIPFSEDAFPSDERVKGIHISQYAKSLIENNKTLYTSQFSQIIKRGLKPETYPTHFETVKKAILNPKGVNKKRESKTKKTKSTKKAILNPKGVNKKRESKRKKA